MTKLNNVTGRSDYISNPEKQDHIYNHEKSSDFDWKEYQEFERKNQKSNSKNNEARELVIALPNEISKLPAEERSKIAHSLAKELVGENRDYEFALHFNKSRTNFHMHLIFSERKRSETAEIKRYKRDMWYDKETNRMAKKNAPGAELRFKKGQPMKDKDGNLRYTDEPFTVKDKKFTTREWLHNTHKVTQEVLSEYGYNLDIYDPESEIKQQKLYKGADSDYLEFAETWNKNAKKINQETKEELGDMKIDRDSLQQKVESFDGQELIKLRKSKTSKSVRDLSKRRRLEKERKAIIEERNVLIDKYQFDLDKKKTNPETVIERLSKRIVNVYDKFKLKKQELIKELVTVKDQFVTESSEIATEKKDDLLEQEPEVFWYDVDWNDDDTRYNISNESVVVFGDEEGYPNVVALAFELSEEELEDLKVVEIPPLRTLTKEELEDLESYRNREKELNNNFYINLDGETVYYDLNHSYHDEPEL